MSQTLHRKLTAILCADIFGYSRLMGDNDVATVQTLNTYRELIKDLIEKNQGRLQDFTGDNFLAEFASVVKAVECGAEIQKTLKMGNMNLPEHRRMMFRMGINLGDVLEEGGRLYGDGVNIAARLESIAEAGGICVSRPVYDQVKKILDFQYDYLGEHKVKNITDPVWVYRVRLDATPESLAKVSVEMQRYPAHEEKLSLAILPFKNISGQPNKNTLADDVTKDLIIGLSRISGLLVSSYNAVVKYKKTSLKAAKIGHDLGVGYVLEGTIQREDDQTGIKVSLINITTGQCLWEEVYEKQIEDRFVLQDRIIKKILSSLPISPDLVEEKPFVPEKIDNNAANQAADQGWEYLLDFTPDGFKKARLCFHQSLNSDPENGRALASLAFVYLEGANMGWMASLGVSYFEARLRARHYLSLSMQNPTPLAHLVQAKLNLYIRQYEEAIKHGRQALHFDPNNPIINSYMGCLYTLAGRPMEAVPCHRKALALDPDHPALYLYQWGFAHYCMGQIEEAVKIMERAHNKNPDLSFYTAPLAAAYAYLGRLREAARALDDYLKTWLVHPNLKWAMFFWPFKDSDVEKIFSEGLLQAKMSGQSNGYYKILRRFKLSGNEIKNLVYGRTITGCFPWSEQKEWIDRTFDGKAIIRGGNQGDIELDRGISTVEDDQLFDQWQDRFRGLKIGGPVYRNPEGGSEKLDEYISFTDYAYYPFSVQK